MKLKQYVIESTTDGSGDSVDTSEGPIFGQLYAVYHDDGDYANNVTVDITYTGPDGDSVTLLALAAAAADSHAMKYPRTQVHLDSDGTGLTLDGTRIAYGLPIIDGVVTVTIAAGGASKSGSETLYVLVND